jgi:hypothetical protein
LMMILMLRYVHDYFLTNVEIIRAI